MCGIGGFSLSKTSRVNSRRLAHELLTLLEYRGGHASGYAAFDKRGELNIYKDDRPGSQLPLSGLPRNSKNVILHTRYATQGSPIDNRNNHPVISGTGKTALVHNGVISNDDEFRGSRHPWEVIGQVDSAVIPNVLEFNGIPGLKDLEGYAAIAWVEQGKPRIHNLARLESSPVHYTWLEDGSLVWASTDLILETALTEVGLSYGHVFELPEKTAMKVVNGIIVDYYAAEMTDDYSVYTRWRSATTGGHGTTSSTTTTTYEDDRPNVNSVGSSFWDDVEFDDRDDTTVATGRALALLEGYEPETNGDEVEGFFLTRDDGSIEFYKTLADLETELDWLSNLAMYDGAPFPQVEHKMKWTNFIIDMGHVSGNQPVSWLEDLAHIDQFESGVVYNLEYIREGAGNILVMRGA